MKMNWLLVPIALMLVASVAHADITTGLQGYWKFNSNLRDETDNWNDGIAIFEYTGTPSTTTTSSTTTTVATTTTTVQQSGGGQGIGPNTQVPTASVVENKTIGMNVWFAILGVGMFVVLFTLGNRQVKVGHVVFSLALFALLIYVTSPIETFQIMPLLSTYGDTTVGSYGSCTVVKIPSNCKTVQSCDTQCTLNILGVCIQSVKTNCKGTEQCDYTNKVSCSNPTSYSSGSQSVSCPSGTVYSNGACTNPWGSYQYTSGYVVPTPVQQCKTTSSTKTRLVCGGDVIANKYISGFRYIQEQTIQSSCNTCGSCSDTVIATSKKTDCLAGTYPFVCRDESGVARCVRYPLEMQVSTILDAIGSLLQSFSRS